MQSKLNWLMGGSVRITPQLLDFRILGRPFIEALVLCCFDLVSDVALAMKSR